jgi:hypothetical protein
MPARKRVQRKRRNNKKTAPPYPTMKSFNKGPKTYRGATGRKFASANNEEIFQYELSPQTADFGVVAAVPDVQSKNTKVFLGALYNRNTTPLTQAIRGKDITPTFYTDKYRVSFAGIVADHADSAMGFILRMHVVQVRIAPSKVPVATDSIANWATGIEALVNREVASSNLTSDFLEFSHKNRNLKIVSSTEVRPNRNNMIRKHISTGSSGEVYSAPSPMCYTIKHQVPTWKQKLVGIANTFAPKLENMWIPAVVFTCDNLSSNTGTFKIEHSSKFYFKDS